MREPILEINNLSVSFFTRHGEIPAVMDFSMTVHAGEAMGLVGESGCGKSTVALAIMRYLGGNGRITEGSIRFRGREMTEMTGAELRELRGSQISMIYQEPMASLNPAMRVGLQLMEVPLSHEYISIEEAKQYGFRTRNVSSNLTHTKFLEGNSSVLSLQWLFCLSQLCSYSMNQQLHLMSPLKRVLLNWFVILEENLEHLCFLFHTI